VGIRCTYVPIQQNTGLQRCVEYLEEKGICNPIKKQSSYGKMGGTYEFGKDSLKYIEAVSRRNEGI
jgi:hypothetical protein